MVLFAIVVSKVELFVKQEGFNYLAESAKYSFLPVPPAVFRFPLHPLRICLGEPDSSFYVLCSVAPVSGSNFSLFESVCSTEKMISFY